MLLRSALPIALLALAGSAHAVSVLNDTYDSGYTVGNINGQNGYDGATYTNTPFNVDATAGVGGGYGVTLDSNADTAGDYNLAFRTLNYATTAADPILNCSVDVASKGFATGADGDSSSGWGMSLYNSAGSQLGQIEIQFAVGSTKTATVYYADGTTVNFTAYPTTGGLNTFRTLGMSVDTVANTIAFQLDGATIGMGTYNASDAVIGDLDLSADDGGYDIGAFDNLKLDAVAAPVPEPSALAALGLGTVAVLRRRKRA